MTLSPDAKAAVAACIATRGPAKGSLLKRCPPSGTPAAAAWQALMLVANPYKASIAALLFMGPNEHDVYREVQAWADANAAAVRGLDCDRRALESLGVW